MTGYPPLSALLPHAPPMLLLDEILGHDGDTVVAVATIRADHPFLDPLTAGVPSHIGIELMAQACGALAGLRASGTGRAPALGFLLGTRRYSSSARWFGVGERLEVRATETYLDGEMGVFDCRIVLDGHEVASAALTVYQPADPAAVLAGRMGR